MFDPRYVRLWPHVLRVELCGFTSGNPHVFFFQALVLDVMQHMFASGRVCCEQTSMSWPLAMCEVSCLRISYSTCSPLATCVGADFHKFDSGNARIVS